MTNRVALSSVARRLREHMESSRRQVLQKSHERMLQQHQEMLQAQAMEQQQIELEDANMQERRPF